MNNQYIYHIRTSFKKVAAVSETAAALFYERLFLLDPSLRPMFKGDLKNQGKKLMMALEIFVSSVSQLDKILPVVRDLGRRHAEYGVRPSDYDTVGEALLWTLKTGLGTHFTPEVEEAWTHVYALLAEVMIEAAESAQTLQDY